VVRGAFDATGAHVEGFKGYSREQKVLEFSVTLPDSGPGGMTHFTAKEAVYVPPSAELHSGGWKLFQTSQDFTEDQLPPYLLRISTGIYFLKTREVDFDSITRSGNWFQYASTPRLREILAKPDSRRQPSVAVAFHMRITRPIVGVLLVLMGLGVILRDQNKNVFVNIGFCLILCLIFYAVVYGCKYMGENDFLLPAFAAWIPVMVFTPFAFLLFDAVHT
jgi:lipopolysaccharide export system permease protein